MKVTQTKKFLEEHHPPRCRKARTRVTSDIFLAEIPEVSAADAPVVFRIHKPIGPVAEIRKHGDKLYELMKRPGDPKLVDVNKPLAGYELLNFFGCHNGIYQNRADAETTFQYEVSYYLIIDGKVWHTTDEPHYLVGDWGGNVSLGVSTWPAPDRGAFSAFDEDEARDAAVTLAKANGSKDPDAFKVRHSWIEVIDPTAVTLHKGPAVFVIQKAVVSTVAIKANTYAEALAMAQGLQPGEYANVETKYNFHGTVQDSEPHLTAGSAI